MKIDILRLIEDALIGGRNGEMAYVENNPFMVQLYREWRNNKKENNAFKDFLLDCLNNEAEGDNIKTKTYKDIKKRYDLSEYDENYKKYKEIQNQINTLERDKQNILKEIAESKNKTLADISTYEIIYGQFSKYIEFKVFVEEVIKIETKDSK